MTCIIVRVGRYVLCLLVASCSAAPGPDLVIDRVDPASATNTAVVPLRVEGTGFHLPLTSDLDDGDTVVGDMAVTVGDVPLEAAVWRGEQLIEGSVPSGLAPGTYDVTLRLGDRTGVLASGYVVTDVNAPYVLPLVPDDLAARLQLARLAEWTGRPDVAFGTWRWLSDRGAAGATTEALRLARALHDRAAVVELLLASSRTHQLDAPEVREMYRAGVDALDHRDAAARFRQYLARHPGDAAAWAQLAELLEIAGEPAESLAVREEIEARPGSVASCPHVWLRATPSMALDYVPMLARMIAKRLRAPAMRL